MSQNHATLAIIAHPADYLRNTGWSPSTLETYGSGLLLFHVYCDTWKVKEEHRAPATYAVLQTFLTAMAGSYSGSTAANYFHSIRTWHIIHSVPWIIDHNKFQVLLKGVNNLTPASSKQKKRAPHTISFMAAIYSQLDLSNNFDVSCYSALTSLFYGTGRVSEVTVKNLSSFDPTIHVKRSDVRVERDRNGLEVTAMFIPQTKTNPSGEDIFWAEQEGVTNLKAAFDKHLDVNPGPPSAPLFAYLKNGVLRPLTKNALVGRLAKAVRDAGLDPLQGHGIRIGSTLEYIL
ncbi:hypothetical protein C8J56DRAFT_1004824 [Mycena floridula]|nr:hypothetical protein C8J56DRAFT_1004824 [Mycena floridula]